MCIFTDVDYQAMGQNSVRALTNFEVFKIVEDKENNIVWGNIVLPNPGWVMLERKGEKYAFLLPAANCRWSIRYGGDRGAT